MKRVHYNDFPELVGQDLGASDWVEITQEKVNEFAEATGDFQWIHVDVERATKELGSPIAHGFLTLSLCSQLMMTILEFDGIK
ncbi:MAG: MaoC/PaaZ C-terminal domain-containing protein, partial [Pseudomonadota bacterium]